MTDPEPPNPARDIGVATPVGCAWAKVLGPQDRC
jgi:hypothetical protein